MFMIKIFTQNEGILEMSEAKQHFRPFVFLRRAATPKTQGVAGRAARLPPIRTR